MLNDFSFDNYKFSFESDSKSDLMNEFARVQRQARGYGLSLLIMIDGWEASGKGYVINDLVRETERKYTRVAEFIEENDIEKQMPFLWRFWKNTPARGETYIYDRSVYYSLMDNYEFTEEEIDSHISDICGFERQLIDDKVIVIKFFLNIDESTQDQRIMKMARDPYEKLLVSERDLRQNENYKNYKDYFSMVMDKSSEAEWHVIDARDEEKASKEVLGKSIEIINKTLKLFRLNGRFVDKRKIEFKETKDYLAEVDTSRKLSKEVYKAKKYELEDDLKEVSFDLFRKEQPAIIIFEGVDAAGKGGAIKRLTKGFDPRIYSVEAISAPNEVEKSHHYLWRFWKTIPKKGEITIYDRSWYGRVLVERLEAFANNYEWQRAYQEINETEEILHKSGIMILKFFLYIDSGTQLERFQDRARDPDKAYKLSAEDWRNRERWDDYIKGYNDMLTRTNTKFAPWIIVPANDKRYARIKVMEEVRDRAKKVLERK